MKNKLIRLAYSSLFLVFGISPVVAEGGIGSFFECQDRNNPEKQRMEACWQALQITDLENEHRAEVYALIAEGFYREKEYLAAVEMATKAIELDPDEPNHWGSRGYNLLELGKYQEAIRDFDTALTLSSVNFSSYIFRGRAYLGLGEIDKAREDFEYATKFKRPQHATHALFERGRFRLQIGEYKAAISDFLASLENDPSNLQSHFHLSVAYSHLGTSFQSLEQAKYHAERALELSPHPYSSGMLAYVLAAMGKETQASKLFEKSVSVGGSSTKKFYLNRLSIAGFYTELENDPTPDRLVRDLIQCAQQRCDLFLPSLASVDNI